MVEQKGFEPQKSPENPRFFGQMCPKWLFRYSLPHVGQRNREFESTSLRHRVLISGDTPFKTAK